MNPLLYIGLGALVLIGLFFLFRPQTQQTSVQITPPENAMKREEKPVNNTVMESNNKVFNLVIKEKKIVSGGDTLKVTQGNDVTINITSDEAEEFHVHAYDNSVELEPNIKATLTFTADKSGRFPFELEESQTELGALEVQPK